MKAIAWKKRPKIAKIDQNCSRTKRATKLRYAPTRANLYNAPFTFWTQAVFPFPDPRLISAVCKKYQLETQFFVDFYI
jgi:hypothetical protein